MDTKTVVISMLLAAIMAGSGAVIYTTSNAVEEQNNPPEKVEPEIQIENNAPKILMDTDLLYTWTGEEISVQGFLYDEDAVSTFIDMKAVSYTHLTLPTTSFV